MRVTLRVPAWAKPGQIIQATASGKHFSVKIPDYLRPGQYFTVRVPDATSDEKTPSVAAPEVAFNLEPNIVIGNDKYFKEVKKCQDWFDCSRLCCPYVIFSAKSEDVTLKHQCCCLPCCFNFEVGIREDGSSSAGKKLGILAPAGCGDQNLCAVCCPCCYSGPKMQAKFVNPEGEIKYTLKSRIQWCQYCCLCLTCCSPCFRCCRFCCQDSQYTRYEQTVYGPDLNDDTPYAKIIYTDRMICPCIPDERIQMRIEPAEGRTISKEDLILLSVFPSLISGYTCVEFCFPLCLPGGMMCSMPTPSGIAPVDDANNIQFEHMNIKEALAARKQDDMM